VLLAEIWRAFSQGLSSIKDPSIWAKFSQSQNCALAGLKQNSCDFSDFCKSKIEGDNPSMIKGGSSSKCRYYNVILPNRDKTHKCVCLEI